MDRARAQRARRGLSQRRLQGLGSGHGSQQAQHRGQLLVPEPLPAANRHNQIVIRNRLASMFVLVRRVESKVGWDALEPIAWDLDQRRKVLARANAVPS